MTCHAFHAHARGHKERHVTLLPLIIFFYIDRPLRVKATKLKLSIASLQENNMRDKDFTSPFSFLLLFFLSLSLFLHAKAFNDQDVSGAGPLVKKDERRSLVVTEYGEVSATEIIDGVGGLYHLQFLTLEPNSLFLPVLLHADMVFYVNTGAIYEFYHLHNIS